MRRTCSRRAADSITGKTAWYPRRRQRGHLHHREALPTRRPPHYLLGLPAGTFTTRKASDPRETLKLLKGGQADHIARVGGVPSRGDVYRCSGLTRATAMPYGASSRARFALPQRHSDRNDRGRRPGAARQRRPTCISEGSNWPPPPLRWTASSNQDRLWAPARQPNAGGMATSQLEMAQENISMQAVVVEEGRYPQKKLQADHGQGFIGSVRAPPRSSARGHQPGAGHATSARLPQGGRCHDRSRRPYKPPRPGRRTPDGRNDTAPGLHGQGFASYGYFLAYNLCKPASFKPTRPARIKHQA